MELIKSKIVLKSDSEIRVVQFTGRAKKEWGTTRSNQEKTFFVGVGDVISHYGGSTVRILSFKQTHDFTEGGMKIVYYYYTLTQCGEKFPDELAQQWTKHASSLSNIDEVLEPAKETKRVEKKWWTAENKRRDKLPRYIVLCDYPNSDYTVGEIIECFDDKFEYQPAVEKDLKKYPHIFKKTTKNLATAAKIGILEA